MNAKTKKIIARKGLVFVGVIIETLLALAIILFLYYIVAKLHLGKPQFDKDTQKTFSEQGINTANYKSLVSTVKKKLQDSQDQEAKRANEMENLK